MNHATLECSIKSRVLTIRLHRPDRLNAFTPTMANELEKVFRRVSDDDTIGAIIVTGAGRGFCAGMELEGEGNVFGLDETLNPTLRDMEDRLEDPEIRDGVRDTGGRVTIAMHNCKKPIIAAINGPAVGVGATMTLAMDFRLASEDARIGFVFGRLGVVPEACSTYFLPRIVGLPKALDLVLTAEIIDAAAALDLGLIRSVHPRDELLPAAEQLAHQLIDRRSPVAVALARQMLLRSGRYHNPLEAHRIESLAMFYTSRNAGKRGVQAFINKEPVDFVDQASLDMPAFYDMWVAEDMSMNQSVCQLPTVTSRERYDHER